MRGYSIIKTLTLFCCVLPTISACGASAVDADKQRYDKSANAVDAAAAGAIDATAPPAPMPDITAGMTSQENRSRENGGCGTEYPKDSSLSRAKWEEICAERELSNVVFAECRANGGDSGQCAKRASTEYRWNGSGSTSPPEEVTLRYKVDQQARCESQYEEQISGVRVTRREWSMLCAAEIEAGR
jgi:hypothetical protein